MGVQGHTTPVWYDEDEPIPDGYVVVWNSTTRRFEPSPIEEVGGTIAVIDGGTA